jgi:iron(III) transport system permease protein
MMSGASVLQVARRITLKLAWPAAFGALLVLFVRSIESFEVPALLGLPVGIQVYTSSIYQAIHQYPSRIGLAAAYAVTLLLLTSFGIYAQARLSSHGSRFATVTGKGFRPRTIDLGGWRYVTAALFVVYFVAIVLLPFCVLVWTSLQKFYSAPSWAALSRVSLDAYWAVLETPQFAQTVWNSLVLATASATIIMLVASVVAWIVIRTKVPGRWLLDNLASLPLVFPGMVLGLAIMVCYLTIDIGVYGTLWIMLIAAMSGAGWGLTFRRVVLPLLKPGLLAGFIYVMIVSIRELSSSILLYSPGTEVVSIMIWELWQNGQYVELSALGVMLIVALFVLVLLAQFAGKRFGIAEA